MPSLPRLSVLAAALGAALFLWVAVADAVGPVLPSVAGNQSLISSASGRQYVAHIAKAGTRITAKNPNGSVAKSVTIDGHWGIPMVTLRGELGGLSPNGRVLVLGDNLTPTLSLRPRSGFTVLDARTLQVTRTISLKGDFSFDALSPDASVLYLINHRSSQALTRYQVRAYDLRAGRLLPQVIADKSQRSWIMNGYAIARATSPGGRWVYTLYQQNDNYPFVHMLDAQHRTAVCVGLPWQWSANEAAISGATLALHGDKLVVRGEGVATKFVIDTKTFKVTASGEDTA